MTLTKYDPFHDLLDFPSRFPLLPGRRQPHAQRAALAAALDPGGRHPRDRERAGVKADLPDVDMKDIQVEIENGTLT